MCSIHLDFCNIRFHSLRIISRNLSHLFGIRNLVPDLMKAKKKSNLPEVYVVFSLYLQYIKVKNRNELILVLAYDILNVHHFIRYIDSSGLSGPLPSDLANMTSLKTL